MVALRRLRRAITVHTIGPSAVLLSNARIEVVERTAPDMPFVIDFAGGGGAAQNRCCTWSLTLTQKARRPR